MLTNPRLCSVRSLAVGKVLTARLVDLQFAPEFVCPESKAVSRLVRLDEIEKTLSRPSEPILDSIPSFVNETQLAVLSEDRSLHQHLAQIYRELAKNRVQIRRLSTAIEVRESRNQRCCRALGSDIDGRGELVNSLLGSDTARHQDSSADGVFLDCVSRFSSDESTSSVGRLQAMFPGSPDYFFETTSSFHPEQYTTKGLFRDPVFVFAMMQSGEIHRTQKYFLIYAETPRRWRPIIMSVTWESTRNQPDFLQAIAPDNNECSRKILPAELREPINMLLHGLKLFDSVTRLCLNLGEDDTGKVIINSPSIEIVEDLSELEMYGEDQLLHDIDDLGCAKFAESEIIVQYRVSSTCFMVQVGSRTGIERKAAFASAGAQTDNGFHEYFRDLKLLNSVGGCTNVAEFIGIVLDETRLHLRSYVYEMPSLGSVLSILACAESRSESIPWSARKIWSKQIVSAVSDVHSKGLVVGGSFLLYTIGVRVDGSAVLTDFRTSSRHIQNEKGFMAPELRNALKTGNKALFKMPTFRMDIFHLSTPLWRLAENIAILTSSLFCVKFGCTKYPRSTCTADHRNPVELPPCSTDVPSYLNEIITKCRSPEPKMRPTARQLLKIMSENEGSQIHPTDMRDIVTKYGAPSASIIECNECSALTTNLHYHCNICSPASFDLCKTCFARGIRCLVPQHRLVKRVLKYGTFVEDTSSEDSARNEN